MELKLIDAEKTAIEWQKKYNELVNENREIKNKVTPTLKFDNCYYLMK